jgi:hypothetical protein
LYGTVCRLFTIRHQGTKKRNWIFGRESWQYGVNFKVAHLRHKKCRDIDAHARTMPIFTQRQELNNLGHGTLPRIERQNTSSFCREVCISEISLVILISHSELDQIFTIYTADDAFSVELVLLEDQSSNGSTFSLAPFFWLKMANFHSTVYDWKVFEQQEMNDKLQRFAYITMVRKSIASSTV